MIAVLRVISFDVYKTKLALGSAHESSLLQLLMLTVIVAPLMEML